MHLTDPYLAGLLVRQHVDELRAEADAWRRTHPRPRRSGHRPAEPTS